MAVSRKLDRFMKFANKLLTPSAAEGFLREALEKHEREIADLNREQLLRSELSTGNPITSGLTGRTIHARKKTPFTLKHTGAFHSSITARLAPKTIIITATDRKADLLQETFTKDILGLGDEAKGEIVLLLRKELPRIMRKEMLQ